MTCLFHVQAQTRLRLFKGTTYVCSSGCYFRGETAKLAFSAAVDFGFGYEKSPLQHGGFGCLGRLNAQVMKCLFMVMSLNPALLISPADFTCLEDGGEDGNGLLQQAARLTTV